MTCFNFEYQFGIFNFFEFPFEFPFWNSVLHFYSISIKHYIEKGMEIKLSFSLMLNVNVFTPWQSALDWGFFNFHQSIYHITMLNFQISNFYFKVELLGLPTNNKYKCLWKPWKNPETPFLYSCKPTYLPTYLLSYLHTSWNKPKISIKHLFCNFLTTLTLYTSCHL